MLCILIRRGKDTLFFLFLRPFNKMVEKVRILLEKLFSRQFIRFVFVAGLNTAFGWCVFALLRFLLGLTPLKDPYVLAALLGTIISVLFNFKTYGTLVFKNGDNRLIFKFLMVCAITYFINIFGIKMLENFGIDNYIASAIMCVPVGLLNFLFNKVFTYSKHTKGWIWTTMVLLLLFEIVLFVMIKMGV